MDSELTVAEEATSRKKAQEEVQVPDPPLDEAEEVIAKAAAKRVCGSLCKPPKDRA